MYTVICLELHILWQDMKRCSPESQKECLTPNAPNKIMFAFVFNETASNKSGKCKIAPLSWSGCVEWCFNFQLKYSFSCYLAHNVMQSIVHNTLYGLIILL